MANWNIVRNDTTYGEPLDPEIIPLCDSLNAAGFVTTSSCCGHGKNWPYIWFEHSTDERIEKMARFVLQNEQGDYRGHFSIFQKEIRIDGYAWLLEIHCNDVYSTTSTDDFLKKAKDAINTVAKLIDEWVQKS